MRFADIWWRAFAGDDLRLRSFGWDCLWVGLIVCSLLFRLFDVVLVGFYSFVGVFGC